jgi:curved DNA-binding protein CbpA
VGYPARDILGIEDDEHLTAQLIKQRHRALSQVFHPDKAGGSVTRMQKVNAAKDDLMRLLANRS